MRLATLMLLLSTVSATAASYGPRVPVGPQAGVTCPAGATQVRPGSSVGGVAGSTYCFAPGTYARLSVVPKTGDTYIGQFGATLDGQGATQTAFSGSASNVTISNLTIKNYVPGLQNGAVANRGAGSNGSNWILKNLDISGSNGSAVNVQNGTSVLASALHDNVQEGYACGGTNVTFADNTIFNNNAADQVSQGWEAGGGKCAYSTGLDFEFNLAYGNHGPGLWTDIDNTNTTYNGNDVHDNTNGGIYHEISYDAKITNNRLKNNSALKFCTPGDQGWLWCAGVIVSSSGGQSGKLIDISGNDISATDATGGKLIGVVQQNRGSGGVGPYVTQNVHVHDNTIDMANGAGFGFGAAQDIGSTAIFTSSNVTFDNDNLLNVSPTSYAFSWNNSWMTLAQFQAAGQETHRPTPPVTTTPSGAVVMTVPPCPNGYVTVGKLCQYVVP